MANLRLLAINSADSRTIKAVFSSVLSSEITTDNILVTSTVEGVPDAKVASVSVQDNGLIVIETRPLTPFTRYFVTFRSTSAVKFSNQAKTEFLLEDGRTNVVPIIASENATNPVRDALVDFLANNIYNLQRGTIIRAFLNAFSDQVNRTISDVRQSKNDNYLSFIVRDERKVRKFGPYDRLNEEGAYEVIRVGLTPEDQTLPGKIAFDFFPAGIITLQQEVISSETLLPVSGFDQFLLKVSKSPVIALNSVKIKYEDGSSFTYDINIYGYSIKNTRYDPDFGATLLTLADNEILLDTDVLDDPSFKIPSAGDTVIVSYTYKNLAKIIGENSVSVTQVLSGVRIPAPAFTTQFTIPNAPIVTNTEGTPVSGGVKFLDPHSKTPFLSTHPAFIKELPFSLSTLPRNPGEYSVDYATGNVIVFGAAGNDGTGVFPPAMDYYYKKTFVPDLDYTYDPQSYELARSPLRDLEDEKAAINFSYEIVLIPGIDYVGNVHVEAINERIGNRINNTGSLRTQKTPITNVFRIFNETQGEVYQVNRFNDTTAFFTANQNEPRFATSTRERATFYTVENETLIPTKDFTNILGTRIFKCQLLNQNIIAASEDCIASSFNTSASFSRGDIFGEELYFDSQILTETQNVNRLITGQYQVNYKTGTVYVGVSPSQLQDVGAVSYRRPVISPVFPHVVAVSKVYYSISQLLGVSKELDYSGFKDAEITPSILDRSDERFLNDDESLPYIVSANTISVSDDIKSIRGIYDVFDLNNNVEPTNFASTATFSGSLITLDTTGVEKRATLVIDGSLSVTAPFLSSGIQLSTAISAIRTGDSKQLIDGYQTISNNVLTFSVASTAAPGDIVDVIYTVVLNGAATPVVDYNKGDYFVDYDYLADEILVSYEYGDNLIDFRNTDALIEGQVYYVTYRVGALRDSLFANFATLINIPELNNFDVDLNRERYRDALSGALKTFTKGPTLPSMKELVSEVTKIDPQITEALFQVWSLGISHLYPNAFNPLGDPTLAKGTFDNGILINNVGQAVTFPVSSNLSLNEGTLEFDIIPEWNGLDNDATIKFFSIKRDGYSIAENQVFIGSGSYNPTFDFEGNFTVNRLENATGLPSAIFSNTGLFVYYDVDSKSWKTLVKESVATNHIWTGSLLTSGEFYAVKFIDGLGEITDVLRSDLDKVEFEFHLDGYDVASPDGYSTTDGYIAGYSFDGISFMSDDRHYMFDFARKSDEDRFSLYKDGRGFLTFEVWDNAFFVERYGHRKSAKRVSYDISNWKAGLPHHVAISWKLNTIEKQDEMHLFVDGFEVPNVIRYGGIPPAVSADRFRTVVPEGVVGTVVKPAIAGIGLITNQGANTVTSETIDFQTLGIIAGDTIEIFEQGFSVYTILSVAFGQLVLSSSMPATLANARFSVNPFTAIIQTEAEIYKNIAVSRISLDGYEEEIPGKRATIPGYRIERNMLNQRILKVTGDVFPGDTIVIRTLGLNHRRCRDRAFLWSAQSVLKTFLPPPVNLDDVAIRSVILPLTTIDSSNSTIVLTELQAVLSAATQTSNTTEGRHLSIRVTGGNVDFSTPTTVTLNGTSTVGVTETLIFNAPGTLNTTGKWQTITSIDVDTTPLIINEPGVSLEIKETYSVTYPDGNMSYPVIRFSFKTQAGLSLEGDGSDIVSDPNGFFLLSDVGNLIDITAPFSGVYQITELINSTTVRLNSAVGVAFTGGAYGIYQVTIARSGFQNGFFTLERAGFTNVAYNLPAGYYDFDYPTYLEVPFNPISQTAFIGNSFDLRSPVRAVIDEFRILKTLSTDTRVGETLSPGQRSITTDATKIRPYKKSKSTLVLLHFDSLPIVNDADYISFTSQNYLQSSESVNSRFGDSIVLRNTGLQFENKGTLNKNQGTIEFWVSPRYDTYNDPVVRYYFDAAANVVENATSITKKNVVVLGSTRQVLSVRLASDVSQTGTNFFTGGSIADDGKTINLGIALPFQKTPVVVAYVPNGLKGDRMSIFKDGSGFLNFSVIAAGQTFELRQPILWPRNTWHRVRVSWNLNKPGKNDEIRLFVDGEERNVIMFGGGLLFGQGFIFGQNSVTVGGNGLKGDINFLDTITLFNVGQDYTGYRGAQARMDNLKISNVAVTPILCGDQPFDVYYNTNPEVLYPAIEDGYTTFLLDFNRLTQRVTDFAVVRDPEFGIFNFILNVIDSFDIVSSSERVRQILYAMINTLKPAASKVQINLVK